MLMHWSYDKITIGIKSEYINRSLLRGVINVRTLSLFLALLFFTGCASTDKKETRADLILLNEAHKEFAKKNYHEAEESYKKILDEHPESRYRINALLGLADSYFRQEKYLEASWHYRDFYELYPVHKSALRARFYRGMCFYIDRDSFDRDQTDTKKALEEFKSIVEEPGYRDTVFYENSKEKIIECEKLLALHTFSVGKFYFDTKVYISAIKRMKDLLKRYPGEPYEDEAFFIIAESYFQEDNYQKAEEYYKNFIDKYSSSSYVELAHERLNKINSAGNRLSRAGK